MIKLDGLVEAGRVHRSIYVDDEVFVEEMHKVFGGTWVYLAHESQLPLPNDFYTTRLGLRPVIVTRDVDGEIHALLNRCSHRASTVCQEECGSARNFQCSYHGWTYSNTGALVTVPDGDSYPADFDKTEHGLAQVPRLASYRGFIFGTLNPDASPILEWLGPAASRIADFVDRSPNGAVQLRNRQRMIYRGNWKLAWDNAADGLHPTFAHRSFVLLNERNHGGRRSLSQFKQNPDGSGMYGEDLGNGHMFVDQRPGIAGSFWETQRPIPGQEPYAEILRSEHGEEASDLLEVAPGSMVNLSIFPNLLFKGNHVEIVEPIAARETRLSTYVVAAEGVPEEVNVLRMRIAEDFPSLGNPDDLEIFERCQEGLSIPEVEWIDMSKGLGSPTDQPDARGVRRVPVTHESAMRGYLREWKRLMASEPRSVVAEAGQVVRELIS